MQERQPRASAGAEITAEAEVDARHGAVENISSEILPAGCDNSGVFVKQPHHRLGNELDYHRDDNSEAESEENSVAKGLLGSLGLVCADILSAESGDSREHRGRHKEEEADDLLHNAHRRRVGQTSVIRNYGYHDEAHLDQTVLQRNGHADFEQLTHHLALRAQVAAAQLELTPLDNDGERNYHAYRLGKGRAEGCTGGA